MNFSVFSRLPIKKVVPTAAAPDLRPQTVVEGLVREIPELLMACVVDATSGKVLAFYTTAPAYNPHQISLRNAKLLQLMAQALACGAWAGGPLTDASIILDDQLHHLRPMNGGKWYGFLAVRTADANLGIAKEALRRHAA